MEKKKCKECGHEIEAKKVIEIKHKLNERVLKVVEAETLRGADLRNADLRYADLRYADLRNADLRYADLRYARTELCTVNFSLNEKSQAKQFAEGIDKE